VTLGGAMLRGLEISSQLALLYSLALALYYLALIVFGFAETLRSLRSLPWQESRRQMRSPGTPGVSLIAAAYNEEAGIVQSVRGLLMLDYPEFEVVVVNDGSKDRTLELLSREFDLYPVSRREDERVPTTRIVGVYESRTHPNLVVIDKVNGGSKATTVNAGLNYARHGLVAIVDADCVFEPDALLRAVRPFQREPGKVLGVGGSICIANGCRIEAGRVVERGLSRNVLARIQTVEYARSFLLGRMAWSRAGGLLIVSGAFGVFDRAAVLEAGGFLSESKGEDFELVMRLHRRMRDARRPYKIEFLPDPICWTEVPETVRVLRRQRVRWHQGLLDTLWRHRHMIARPRYGVVGMVAMPAFILFEALGPLVELFGLVVVPLAAALGLVDARNALSILLVAMGLGAAFSASAVLLDDLAFRRYRPLDLVTLVLAALAEGIVYRQITVWWRVKATWDYVRGRQHAWGAMERRGLGR
jgi:cellulose synthase/poly-beta-1,6-N-acetylglucosamine synthase-like glycosyltransferase